MTDTETDWPAILRREGRKLGRINSKRNSEYTRIADLAVQAHAAGQSENNIANCLGVDRGTVRAWLGKERKR